LVRMSDNKLLTELCDSFMNGIRTTDKAKLDSVYRSRDAEFRESEIYYERLLNAFNEVRAADALHETVLMKPHLVYSLVQAITHVIKPVQKFNKIVRSPRLRSLDWTTAMPNLTALAQAIDAEQPNGRFASFVSASREKTNVTETRKTRFKWMCKAFIQDQI
jgi:hypothetical protein